MKPYYEDKFCQIFHGDCRNVLPELEVKNAVIITDPPYNAKKNYGKTTNDNQDWNTWCGWFDEYLEVMAWAADDIVAFMSQTAWRKYTRHGRHEIDWTLNWFKPLSLSVCAMPFMPHWEPIAYWGITRKKDKAFWGSDVLTHNVVPNKFGHPTEKPLPLLKDLVSRFKRPVIDPFAGSFTTARAAKDLGLKSISVEINEKFCEIAALRLQQEVLEFV